MLLEVSHDEVDGELAGYLEQAEEKNVQQALGVGADEFERGEEGGGEQGVDEGEQEGVEVGRGEEVVGARGETGFAVGLVVAEQSLRHHRHANQHVPFPLAFHHRLPRPTAPLYQSHQVEQHHSHCDENSHIQLILRQLEIILMRHPRKVRPNQHDNQVPAVAAQRVCRVGDVQQGEVGGCHVDGEQHAQNEGVFGGGRVGGFSCDHALDVAQSGAAQPAQPDYQAGVGELVRGRGAVRGVELG